MRLALDLDAPRVRHAVRTAAGGAALALLSQTRASGGCLSSVLFYISTVAGTPEPYAGFVVRSAALTFVAALLSSAALVAVLSASGHAAAAAFFLYLPLTVACSALRPDRSLLPLPVVINVVLGFLLISQIGAAPEDARAVAVALVAESALALAACVAVCVPWADRADTAAHAIIADELTRAAEALSHVASRIFASDDPPTDNVSEAGLAAAPCSNHTPPLHSPLPPPLPTPHDIQGVYDMLADDARVSAEWERTLPPGRTRVSTFTALARARQLLSVASYEPRLRRRVPLKDTAWADLLSIVDRLFAKVSSIEAAALVGENSEVETTACEEKEGLSGATVFSSGDSTPRGSNTPETDSARNGDFVPSDHTSTKYRDDEPVRERGSRVKTHFSRDYLVRMFGEESLPLWRDHFNVVAAACSVAADHVRSLSRGEQSDGLGEDLDARSPLWASRRADLYSSFLAQFRDYWGTHSKPERTRTGCEGESEDNDEHASSSVDDPRGPLFGPVIRGSQIRPLIYVAVTSQALSENVSRIQASLRACANTRRNFLALFRWLILPWIPLFRRLKMIALLRIESWEVKFAFTHSLMSATIVALSLFVPGLQQFDSSQVAWVYASAGLAAQLSVESTLFIGFLRVVVTFAGSFLAFGVNAGLKATNSPSAPLGLGPFMGAVALAALLLLPRKLRYASFLFIVTNGLVSFCPRLDEECSFSPAELSDACFPDVHYAIARSINVAVGVVFALVFHGLLFPRFAQSEARRALASAFGNSAYVFHALHGEYSKVGLHPDSAEDEETAKLLTKSRSQSSSSPGTVPLHSRRDDTVGYIVNILTSEGVMGEVEELQVMTLNRVGRPLSEALLLLNTDANSWSSGRLAVPPVLKELPGYFISLNISLSEMASMLGRKPVLSGQYCRTAHDLFMVPLRYEYCTLLVSLHNLSTVVQQILRGRPDHACLGDLEMAKRHLSLTLRLLQNRVSELRIQAHRQRRRQMEENRRRSRVQKDLRRQVQQDLRRSWSSDCLGKLTESGNLRQFKEDLGQLHLYNKESPPPTQTSVLLLADDVVLYNAFSFASNASVSAFMSIADVIERNFDSLKSQSLLLSR